MIIYSEEKMYFYFYFIIIIFLLLDLHLHVCLYTSYSSHNNGHIDVKMQYRVGIILFYVEKKIKTSIFYPDLL